MIDTLTIENFENAAASKEPILVDFWAEWCGPCMMQGEILHKIAKEYPKLKIGKVNVDENPQLAAKFRIEAIPAMMLFQNGKCMETVIGLRQETELLKLFRRYGGDLSCPSA